MGKRLKCFLTGGHRYYKDKIFSANVERWKCEKCGYTIGVNHDCRIVLPWDNELQHMVDTLYKSAEEAS
jgi:transposase-like protein